MKVDLNTGRVERTAEDRERHRLARERLQFTERPTESEVSRIVDTLVSDGVLRSVPTAIEIADFVRELRLERERQGLSVGEIARRLGWSESEVADLESGQRPNPSVETLTLWAKALGKRIQLQMLDV